MICSRIRHWRYPTYIEGPQASGAFASVSFLNMVYMNMVYRLDTLENNDPHNSTTQQLGPRVHNLESQQMANLCLPPYNPTLYTSL